MIVVRRRAAAIASALVLAAITMQLANAHTIEEGRGDYTFGPTVKNLALGAKLEQHVVNAGGGDSDQVCDNKLRRPDTHFPYRLSSGIHGDRDRTGRYADRERRSRARIFWQHLHRYGFAQRLDVCESRHRSRYGV